MSRPRSHANAAGADLFSVVATNEYSSIKSIQSGIYPWSLLVEPYRETTLTLQASGSSIDLSAADTLVEWSITGPDTTSFSFAGNGSSVLVTFEGVGRYTVDVKVAVGSTGDSYTYSTTAVNKYVRREIRTLTDAERESFLDALHTVYTVSTEEGKLKYGDQYRDIAWFVRKHLYGAASKECDHWHDDSGMVNHHVAFTLEMEQVLQQIDAKLAIPYWEYTIDADLSSWEDSIVFDADWFGVASPTNDQHIVTEGRWAYTPVLTNASSFSRAYNPYGLLRSPWNADSTPHFTRNHYMFGSAAFYFPTCEDFSECYNSTSFADMSLCLNGYTHGPVHIKIGGEWGMEAEKLAFVEDLDFVVPFLLLVKNLWRHGVITCPSDCTTLAEGETCKCRLTDGLLDRMSAYEVLTEHTGVMYQMTDNDDSKVYWDEDSQRYKIVGVEGEEDENEVWLKLLDALSTPYYAGEMYTSAAPYDPTFWIIHPTAERLLNARRVYSKEGEFDLSWGYDHATQVASDDGQVCDWTGVTGTDLPNCTSLVCDGHNDFDVLPFNKFKPDGSDLVYTNKAFLEFIDPFNEDLPYLYDSYEWPHCTSTPVGPLNSGS